MESVGRLEPGQMTIGGNIEIAGYYQSDAVCNAKQVSYKGKPFACECGYIIGHIVDKTLHIHSEFSISDYYLDGETPKKETHYDFVINAGEIKCPKCGVWKKFYPDKKWLRNQQRKYGMK